MDLGLKGLRAIVTGGTKGIGLACAEILTAEGAAVSICARTSDDVDTTVARLKPSGATAHGMAVDVADKAALEDWVAASAKAMGGIDIVIGNVSALAVNDDEEAWQTGFDTDMMHVVRMVNASVRHQ